MKQQLSVALLPSHLDTDLELSETCSIVIDVLRATTVMTTALSAGARQIETVGDLDEAFRLAASREPRALLCGERECKLIPGFDLSNSPAEYLDDVVTDRDLVLTTTNGTRAIEAVGSSKRLLVASFLNLSATIDAIASESKLQIVCAGTNGQISCEDILLAGAMVERLTGDQTELDDSARLARASWRELGPEKQIEGKSTVDTISAALKKSLGGRNLIQVGYEPDIVRCAALDQVTGYAERIPGSKSTFRYFG